MIFRYIGSVLMKYTEVLEAKIETLRFWTASPFFIMLSLIFIATGIDYLIKENNLLYSLICTGIALLIEVVFLYLIFLISRYQKELQKLKANS